MKLSIIIPTLNEAEYLPETILKLRENAFSKDIHELIVVDSGSMDDTPEIAEHLGAKLLRFTQGDSGKALLLNAGAEAASGDVYMFVDADTILPQAYDILIEKSLADSSVVGGAFEFSLDGQEFGLRVVEFINRVRYRFRQRYYGDQCLFVSANVFKRVGGFPQIRLLESAYLCKMLRTEGKLKLINRPIKTSSRRFTSSGIYHVLASDIKIWFLDLLGLVVDSYAESYWKENTLRRKI